MNFAKIDNDMKTAWKAGDKQRKDVLANVIGSIKKAAIDDGCRDNIPDSLVDKVLLKELKTVNEQIETCPADRTELMEKYTFARDVITEYVPKMLSYDEVKAIIIEKFSDVIATKNKGMIMKSVMGELKGKADGKVINQVVAELVKL